tara:strand:+ start:11376 stop:11615 length:240 start_codon:yes stop_codon:yes gene_type:complete
MRKLRDEFRTQKSEVMESMMNLQQAISPLTEPDTDYRMSAASRLWESIEDLEMTLAKIKEEAYRIGAEAEEDSQAEIKH